MTLLNLASVLRDREEFARALPLFEQALAIEENAFGKDNSGVAFTLGELGSSASPWATGLVRESSSAVRSRRSNGLWVPRTGGSPRPSNTRDAFSWPKDGRRRLCRCSSGRSKSGEGCSSTRTIRKSRSSSSISLGQSEYWRVRARPSSFCAGPRDPAKGAPAGAPRPDPHADRTRLGPPGSRATRGGRAPSRRSRRHRQSQASRMALGATRGRSGLAGSAGRKRGTRRGGRPGPRTLRILKSSRRIGPPEEEEEASGAFAPERCEIPKS